MQEPNRARLLAVETLHQELVLGDRGPLEGLVQPRHGPGVGVHEASDPPDVLQERGAVLLAVVGVQSLGDQPGANDLDRAPILPDRCAAGQSVRLRPPRGVHTTRRSPAATGRNAVAPAP